MISVIYHTVFYQPLYNGLVFLTKILPFNDLGLSIVVLTLVVRFIIFPLSHRATVTQRKMKVIEPEVSKIKQQLKDKKEEQAKRIMELYRVHGISPFSGFLMILVQLPIFIALLMLLREGFKIDTGILYSFVKAPEEINSLFLSLIDMSKSNYILSFLAAVSQYFQIRLAMPTIKNDKHDTSFKSQFQKSMSIQMKYIMPVFIFFIAQRFASGLALYWTVSNVFAIVHETIVRNKSRSLEKDNGRDKSKN